MKKSTDVLKPSAIERGHVAIEDLLDAMGMASHHSEFVIMPIGAVMNAMRAIEDLIDNARRQ